MICKNDGVPGVQDPAGEVADLLRTPESIHDLPPQHVLLLLPLLTSLQNALVLHLLAAKGTAQEKPSEVDADRLMAAEETAQIIGVSQRWLYRQAKNLPFAVSLSRKALRFSERGLHRWLATRPRISS